MDWHIIILLLKVWWKCVRTRICVVCPHLTPSAIHSVCEIARAVVAGSVYLRPGKWLCRLLHRIARCKLKCISHKLQSLKEVNNFNPQINAKKFARCCGIYLVCTYSTNMGSHLFDDIATAAAATTFQDISPEYSCDAIHYMPHKNYSFSRARAHNLFQSLSTSVRLGAATRWQMVSLIFNAMYTLHSHSHTRFALELCDRTSYIFGCDLSSLYFSPSNRLCECVHSGFSYYGLCNVHEPPKYTQNSNM